MFLDYFSTSSLELIYRPDLSQLTGRWRYSVSEPELMKGYEAMRQAALHHSCTNWLLDSRRRSQCPPTCVEWVTTQFLPEVQRELGSPLRVCFLVLPDFLGATQETSLVSSSGPVQFARFHDEGSAHAWLMAQQVGR